MTKVVFNKNAGRFKKGQVVDLPPALADFFVSKVRCADIESAPAIQEDFSDILKVESPAPQKRSPYKVQKNRRYARRDMIDYSKQDLRAAK